MNKKILIYGNGFLGKRLSVALGAPIATGRIKGPESFVYASVHKPDIIINCIGVTGRPNVDWCEDHKPETYYGNVHVPYLLAEYCKKNGIKLVHISSGCIYQGDNGGTGWRETDTPNFEGSYYSHTKSVSERLLSAYEGVLTLRIRMPIDSTPGDRELIGKLLKYQKIVSSPNSVTVVDDIVSALEALIEKDATGIFNVTNPEPVTHEQILGIYQEVKGVDLNKEYITVNTLDGMTKAPRSNCVLNTEKIQALGPVIRPTEEALRDVLTKYVANGG